MIRVRKAAGRGHFFLGVGHGHGRAGVRSCKSSRRTGEQNGQGQQGFEIFHDGFFQAFLEDLTGDREG